MNNYKTKDYERIDMSLKQWLLENGKTQSDLARALGISVQLLQRYTHGKVKNKTPDVVGDMINRGIRLLK